jgi:hypothetical protein
VREREDDERRHEQRHAGQGVRDATPEARPRPVGKRADQQRKEEREGALGADRDPDRPG